MRTKVSSQEHQESWGEIFSETPSHEDLDYSVIYFSIFSLSFDLAAHVMYMSCSKNSLFLNLLLALFVEGKQNKWKFYLENKVWSFCQPVGHIWETSGPENWRSAIGI